MFISAHIIGDTVPIYQNMSEKGSTGSLTTYDEQRFALITGCGPNGIGQALCAEFLAYGYQVIATVLPGEEREHLRNSGCFIHECDVTNSESVNRLHFFVQQLTEGRLDVLVNNAGICYQFPAVDYDMRMVDRLMAVNVVGAMRMVQTFHREIVNVKGVIMNTCSVAAMFPTVYQAAYCATKAALLQYGNTLRIELAPLGVRVINVVSGEVNTGILNGDLHRQIPKDSLYAPMSDRFIESLNRENPRMDPTKYAQGVVRNATSYAPKPHYWRGTWAPQIRFIDRFLPKTAYDAIAKPMYHLEELIPEEDRQFSLGAKFMAKMVRQG